MSKSEFFCAECGYSDYQSGNCPNCGGLLESLDPESSLKGVSHNVHSVDALAEKEIRKDSANQTEEDEDWDSFSYKSPVGPQEEEL